MAPTLSTPHPLSVIRIPAPSKPSRHGPNVPSSVRRHLPQHQFSDLGPLLMRHIPGRKSFFFAFHACRFIPVGVSPETKNRARPDRLNRLLQPSVGCHFLMLGYLKTISTAERKIARSKSLMHRPWYA